MWKWSMETAASSHWWMWGRHFLDQFDCKSIKMVSLTLVKLCFVKCYEGSQGPYIEMVGRSLEVLQAPNCVLCIRGLSHWERIARPSLFYNSLDYRQINWSDMIGQWEGSHVFYFRTCRAGQWDSKCCGFVSCSYSIGHGTIEAIASGKPSRTSI